MKQAVADWRGEIERGGAVLKDDATELESHLSDEIELLASSGLTDEEAYLIALRRMGSPTSLTHELGKINTKVLWSERSMWMAGGILVYIMLDFFTKLAADFGTWIGASSGLRGQWLVGVALAPKLVIPMVAGALLYLVCSMRRTRGAVTRWMACAQVSFILIVGACAIILQQYRFYYLDQTIQTLGVQSWMAMMNRHSYWATIWAVLLPIMLAGIIVALRVRAARQAGRPTTCS